MKYTIEDINRLKSPEIMRAYAAARLDGQTVGKGFKCVCPWGKHQTHLKVEISEYRGQGRATCWACDKRSVNIFELASGVSGIPNDRAHVQELADLITGEIPSASASCGVTAPQSRQHPQRELPAPRCTRKPATDELPTCVEEAARELAMEAVERLKDDSHLLAEIATGLGLPERALMLHLDRTSPEGGLLGATPGGLLLFISTDLQDGVLQVTAIKERAPKSGAAPAEVIEGGRWVNRGTMCAGIQGGKFRACVKGVGAGLWGLGAVAYHDTAIITEGESDKLAVDLSLDALRACLAPQGAAEHMLPAVVACPGAQNFKREWARPFRAKTVIVCGDNDEAGRQGMRKTAGILLNAGALAVKMWSPHAGCKDAREQFDAAQPEALSVDVITRNEPYTTSIENEI